MSEGVVLEVGEEKRLARVLERAAELIEQKTRLEAETKKIGAELREVERQAVELLAATGLDNVRVAGKSWRRREFFSVSIIPERKADAVKAAASVCPEYITVNTSSLKSWLTERRKEGTADGGLAAGTPFEGMISEFREMRLAHLTVG